MDITMDHNLLVKQGVRFAITVTEKKEWCLEYEAEINRPGLLDGVSGLLGMLGISVVTTNGVGQGRRGLLIKIDNLEKVERFEQIIRSTNEIEITKFKKSELRDRLVARHGRYIE